MQLPVKEDKAPQHKDKRMGQIQADEMLPQPSAGPNVLAQPLFTKQSAVLLEAPAQQQQQQQQPLPVDSGPAQQLPPQQALAKSAAGAVPLPDGHAQHFFIRSVVLRDRGRSH